MEEGAKEEIASPSADLPAQQIANRILPSQLCERNPLIGVKNVSIAFVRRGVDDDIKQRTVNMQLAIVLNEAQLPEFVHEVTHA